MRRIFFGALGSLLLFSTQAISQPEPPEVKSGKERRDYVYVGLQVNQLLKQLVSFGNSSPADNPFLLTFASNTRHKGGGISMGIGYSVGQTISGDNITTVRTNASDFFFRFGYDRKSQIASRWLVGWGVDLVSQGQKNKTTTESDFGGGATTIETLNKTGGWGFGPRAGLSFKVNERILVGTESFYYFKSLKRTIEVDPNNGAGNTEEKLVDLQLKLPSAVYAILRF